MTLISDAIPQNSLAAILLFVKVLNLVNPRPSAKLDLEC